MSTFDEVLTKAAIAHLRGKADTADRMREVLRALAARKIAREKAMERARAAIAAAKKGGGQ